MKIIYFVIFVWIAPSILFAQPNLVKTVVPLRTQEYVVSIEYINDYKEHCKNPLKYIIRKTGTINQNTKLQWTYQYVPCGKTSPIKETITFLIPKGTGNVSKEFFVSTINTVTLFDDNSLISKVIQNPEFIIKGPATVMEDDMVNLQVEPRQNTNARWTWAKGTTKNIIGTGLSISQALKNTTRFYAWSEVEGFRSGFKEYIVNVIKRPDPPSDFKITGPSQITDIQSANLEIKSASTLENVHWIWETDNQKIGEGLSIAVNPKKTTVYSVHSEYYGKRSKINSFQLNVKVLPEAPSSFQIIGPDSLYEGQSTWLKISPASSDTAVKWVWSNSLNRNEIISDSILIHSAESMTYKVYAELNGKKSAFRNKSIKVIQLAAAPEVVGNFRRCISSDIPSVFILKGGKLGTGSKNWKWYEGVCGSGRLIHTGSSVELRPSRTTQYYVQPDNNNTVCKSFVVEVGLVPALPEKLVSNEMACRNEAIVIEAVGTPDPESKWIWFAQELNTGIWEYKGEGIRLFDTIKNSTNYIVRSENSFCRSTDVRKLFVYVRPHTEMPLSLFAAPLKGRHYLLTASGLKLEAGSKLVWYKDQCGGKPWGYGPENKYKAKKTNEFYIRTEGLCDTSDCKLLKFQYRKAKSKYIFLNAGLASNVFNKEISQYNGQLTIGSQKIYLRGKVPFSVTQSKRLEKIPFQGTNLEGDNVKVTNYPVSSNTYYKYNDVVQNETYGISGGVFLGSGVVKLYVGGGYGVRDLYWQVDIYDYSTNGFQQSATVKNIMQSVSGPLVEGGILLRIGAINLMGGMSMIIGSNSVLYRDVNVGIGINFFK